jgi:protein SCO1/2
VLFVSVDPDRDTPQRLRRYTAYFAPDILGVTGTPQELAKAAALYGAGFPAGRGRRLGDGLFDRSQRLYLSARHVGEAETDP